MYSGYIFSRTYLCTLTALVYIFRLFRHLCTRQGVATHALRVERRTRINFYDRFSDDVSRPLSPAKAMRRVSKRERERVGSLFSGRA